MKKMLAAILTLLIFLCPAALAQTVTVNGAFELDVPDAMQQNEITQEDAESGLVLDIADGEALYIWVYAEDAEGYTLDDLLAEYQADEELSEVAIREANGLSYLTFGTDSMTYNAIALDGAGDMYTFTFLYDDDTPVEELTAIMDTIKTA